MLHLCLIIEQACFLMTTSINHQCFHCVPDWGYLCLYFCCFSLKPFVFRSLTGKEEEQEEEEEEIHVYSNRDLLQRRDVNINGKTIVFRAMNGFDGFSDRIKINIPPFSVLGNETICLEIIPEYIVNNYNRMRTNRIIITPILHVDRKNSAPFLRTVTITLPLTSDSNKWLAPGIKGCPPTMEYSKKMLSVTIKTKTFSPVAGVYEPIKEVLDAMGLDDESAITYEMRGIYLIIDQLTTFSEFDLRKFKDWREHRKFRMDETKFFWMLFNPPEMKECYYRKEIKVTIGGWLFKLFFNSNVNLSTRKFAQCMN